MAKLLIVESPAKAKTISKYLGSDYVVRASVGHVRDLPKSNKKAIDIEGGFIPHYEVVKGKESVLSDIKKLAKKADEVLLATDPDREGEAIAWHVKEAIGLKKPKRVVFYEITKEAVTEAVSHPRDIDDNLRRAQEARRVLDRLVGYDLSGLIWKKVRYGLSAGRVQSPALRILMEREREIRAFVAETFWTISVRVRGTESTDEMLLTCVEEPRSRAEVDRILAAARKHPWRVSAVEESEMKRMARPPFTTSTLQQAASSRLGFAPSRTMGVAQKLYEAGHITYMRTDSTNLSITAKGHIASVVAREFGQNYVALKDFKTKSKNAQEAHEAIRPTNAGMKRAGANEEQRTLYELIWGRTVASQMADARLMKTRVVATSDPSIPAFAVGGTRLLFDGWIAADPDARGEDVALPKVAAGDALTLIEASEEERVTMPPPRYTEAGLVKELEKRGIGRPSTYASIIKTIVDRGYVEKNGKTLIPTDTGDVVSTFLENNFQKYVSDTFTAEMEDKLDEIANGARDYVKTLRDFYTPFLKEVKGKEHLDKATTLGAGPKEFPCPKCGGDMVVKLSRNGKFLSCATFPDCIGARAMDGSELAGPKETGETCPKCTDGKLIERDGKYGRFIACSNYPKCKYVKKSAEEEARGKTGVACPVCGEGEMVERRGRFGPFFSCSNYPKCKNAIKARPTGNLCSLCDSLMMDGTKTIPERCSNKGCPNHNPHKKK